MNCKLTCCVALLAVFLIFPARATMVSFLIVETGIEEGFPETEFGAIWEDGLMASFFDAGVIVTNSPILRMEERPEYDITGTLRAEFDEAVMGGANYFVMCFINHEIQGRRAVPTNITIQKYRTDTQELVFQQSFPVGNNSSQSTVMRNAMDAGRVIASRINR